MGNQSSITLAELQQHAASCTTYVDCVRKLIDHNFSWAPARHGMAHLRLRLYARDPHIKQVDLTLDRMEMQGLVEARLIRPTLMGVDQLTKPGPVTQHAIGEDPCLQSGKVLMQFFMLVCQIFHIRVILLDDAAEVPCNGHKFYLSIVRLMAGLPGFYESLGFQLTQEVIREYVDRLSQMTLGHLIVHFPRIRVNLPENESEIPPDISVRESAKRFLQDRSYQRQYCSFFALVSEVIMMAVRRQFNNMSHAAKLEELDLPDLAEYCEIVARERRKSPELQPEEELEELPLVSLRTEEPIAMEFLPEEVSPLPEEPLEEPAALTAEEAAQEVAQLQKQIQQHEAESDNLLQEMEELETEGRMDEAQEVESLAGELQKEVQDLRKEIQQVRRQGSRARRRPQRWQPAGRAARRAARAPQPSCRIIPSQEYDCPAACPRRSPTDRRGCGPRQKGVSCRIIPSQDYRCPTLCPWGWHTQNGRRVCKRQRPH